MQYTKLKAQIINYVYVIFILSYNLFYTINENYEFEVEIKKIKNCIFQFWCFLQKITLKIEIRNKIGNAKTST